jgi:hypothetical protein
LPFRRIKGADATGGKGLRVPLDRDRVVSPEGGLFTAGSTPDPSFGITGTFGRIQGKSIYFPNKTE